MAFVRPIILLGPLFLAGCGSYLVVDAQSLSHQVTMSAKEKSSVSQATLKWSGLQKVSKQVRWEDNRWSFLGGHMAKGQINLEKALSQAGASGLALENVQIVTRYRFMDVLLGIIPFASRRTVSISAEQTEQ